MKYETGSARPVSAMTQSKKKPQRGQTVGTVKIMSAANPPQPTMMRKSVDVKYARKDGCDCIERIILREREKKVRSGKEDEKREMRNGVYKKRPLDHL